MQQNFTTDNKLVRLIIEPGYRWLRHLLLCSLLLIVSYGNVIFTYHQDSARLGWAMPVIIVIQFILYLSFYFNIYLLVPRLFLRGKYAAYTVALFILLNLNFAGSYYLEVAVNRIYTLEPSPASYASPDRWFFIDYISLIAVTGMYCLGTTITILFRNWLTDSKRKEEMESEERRNRILEFKEQVNPALLSGILCQAAVHTGDDAALSADILTRLSRYLRYRLYDSNREIVFLNSEVAFLDNYLSLVTHVRENFTYSISIEGQAARAALPPLVLVGVTDTVLNETKRGRPLALALEFITKEDSVLLNIYASSPANPPAQRMNERLAALLDIYHPSGYELSTRGGAGKMYIMIGFNETSIYERAT